MAIGCAPGRILEIVMSIGWEETGLMSVGSPFPETRAVKSIECPVAESGMMSIGCPSEETGVLMSIGCPCDYTRLVISIASPRCGEMRGDVCWVPVCGNWRCSGELLIALQTHVSHITPFVVVMCA